MYTKHSSNLQAHPIILLVGFGLLLMHTLGGGYAQAGSQPEMKAEEALGQYGLIDGWVRAWDLPAAESPQALGEPLCAAVVTLRLDGRVFGRGSAASPDPDQAARAFSFCSFIAASKPSVSTARPFSRKASWVRSSGKP